MSERGSGVAKLRYMDWRHQNAIYRPNGMVDEIATGVAYAIANVAEERRACAKIAQSELEEANNTADAGNFTKTSIEIASDIAAAIEARGQREDG